MFPVQGSICLCALDKSEVKSCQQNEKGKNVNDFQVPPFWSNLIHYFLTCYYLLLQIK